MRTARRLTKSLEPRQLPVRTRWTARVAQFCLGHFRVVVFLFAVDSVERGDSRFDAIASGEFERRTASPVRVRQTETEDL
jgi:hypothetical protein